MYNTTGHSVPGKERSHLRICLVDAASIGADYHGVMIVGGNGPDCLASKYLVAQSTKFACILS